MRAGPTPSWLPTPTQTALLQACLLDGDARLEAWRRFRSLTDLDSADTGSHRLLPLAYRRLTEAAQDDPDLRRLRGIHRRAWYANLLLRTNAERLLRRFADADIEVALLKGAGLHTTVYRGEPTLRPLDDIDLLVRPERAVDALRMLIDDGYRPIPGVECGPDGWALFHHSTGYERGPAESVDLHLRPLHYQRDPGYTDRCWGRRVAVDFGDIPSSTLDPTDHLVVTVLHAAAANPVPPCRWAADAMALIRAEPIVWDRLADDTLALGRPGAMVHGLRYLRDHFAAAVPPGVLARLDAAPTPALTRFVEFVDEHTPSRGAIMLRAVAGEYLVATAGRAPWARVSGYPRYVATRAHRGPRGTARRLAAILRFGPDAPV